MPKMTIVLASRTEQENFLMLKKIEEISPAFPETEFVSVHPMGLSSALDASTAIVVLNFNEWTRKDFRTINELDESGYRGPILVVVKSRIAESGGPMGSGPESNREIDNVVFLEKPFESKDLLGILHKMLTVRTVAQRIHRRFYTAHPAEVEQFGKTSKIPSRVRNLSRGGAYLEFATSAPINVGEMVRVKFELDEVSRTYTMSAKVVWASRATSQTGGGIGVEFIGPADVRRKIIGY